MWHRLLVWFDIKTLRSKQILKNSVLSKNLIVAGFDKSWMLAPRVLLHYAANILAPAAPVSYCPLTRALNYGLLRQYLSGPLKAKQKIQNNVKHNSKSQVSLKPILNIHVNLIYKSYSFNFWGILSFCLGNELYWCSTMGLHNFEGSNKLPWSERGL